MILKDEWIDLVDRIKIMIDKEEKHLKKLINFRESINSPVLFDGSNLDDWITHSRNILTLLNVRLKDYKEQVEK